MKETRRQQGISTSGAATVVAPAIAIIVFVITPLLALAAVAPGRGAVQENPRVSNLQIEIWPEFDRRQAALVILKAELAADVVLPATVSLRIPVSSGGPTAVAFSAAAEGELFNLGYERTNAANFITLRLQAPQRFFHVEFYDPLTTRAPDNSYIYVWPGDLGVSRLSVRLQQPASASGFSVRPELSAGSAGPDGLRYWTAELGPVGAEKQLPIEIRYTKTDPRTTTEILGLRTPDVIPAASTVTSAGLPWGLLIFAATLALAIATGMTATLWWRRRKNAFVARSRSAGFCPECGAQLGPGDRFCSACGAPARKK
ncbi:MAG: hypothetical protein A3H97_10690 [Acidobacteria bacterium RIFCSPLOWO2_02_FULL_65_29]|nr:MAG: hypothetical protein A3H97_10690 [Acidobacteria bacterium RIFCSPLOWO2_02_FULL_65_29]